jgi:hypothetical protein
MKLMNNLAFPHGRREEISCRQVVRELSTYIESGVDLDLRREIEHHLAGCIHCTAIYDGLRNVITLMADNRTFELPVGFSHRLRAKLSVSD